MRPFGKAFCAEKQAAEAIVSGDKKTTSIKVTDNAISLHDNKSVVSHDDDDDDDDDDDKDDLLFSPFSNDGDGNVFFLTYINLIAVQQHFRAPLASPDDHNEGNLKEIDDAIITQTHSVRSINQSALDEKLFSRFASIRAGLDDSRN
jgi:hypothetical protein